MIILGINSYHPDSSTAIIIDGKLIAACEEERFKRIKHFAGFPSESIKYCLKEGGVSIKDVDYIAIPRDPNANIFKKIFYGLKIPRLAMRRVSLWGKTFDIKKNLSELFDTDEKEIKARVIKIEHHRSHLASSFFVSDFEQAFLFSTDALGDFTSTMWAMGQGNNIRVSGGITFPHSLGFYYTAITQYLGFLRFGDEYKVMGLAPYGEATFEDEFKKILKIEKRRFVLNLEYFLHHQKLIDMTFKDGYPEIDLIFSPYLEKRLGKRRSPDEPLEKRHKDIAFSLQKRLEDVIIHLLNSLSPGNLFNLCLCGGVSHNSVANGRIFGNTPFQIIYIPPAPGDGGLAVGAAFYLWNQILGNARSFSMKHASWGPAYEEDEITAELEAVRGDFDNAGCVIEKLDDENELCRRAASEIANGKIVGWFQDRMELGPRALGNRSILADPRKEGIKDILNKRIKYREPFRPFAPSIMEEYVGEYFEQTHPSPFMSFVYKIRKEKRNAIPAVCHLDGTGRLQTVNKELNPLYWKLINEFKNITGLPVLLNTSFNENEPIVRSPKEAIDCFLRTRMDMLVLGPFIINRASRNSLSP